MKKIKTLAVPAGIAAAVALILLMALPVYAVSLPVSQEVKRLTSSVRPVIDRGVSQPQTPAALEAPEFRFSRSGHIRNLTAPSKAYFPVANAVPGRPAETSRNFLREYSAAFGIISPKVDFRSIQSRVKKKRNFEKLEQTYDNIPVFAAQALVQLNERGGVEYVLSDISRDVTDLENGTVKTVPTIDAQDAVEAVTDFLSSKYPEASFHVVSSPVLNIFDPSVVGGQGLVRLVWNLKTSGTNIHVNSQFLVDAHNGEIAAAYPLAFPALSRVIFDSGNSTADPGTSVRTEGGPASGIGDADDVYDYLGDVYNFYNSEHNRDSIDNGGMALSASVRYCQNTSVCPMANAYWSSTTQRLYFGEGWAADDITAHEYTHGVTDHESDLLYVNASGAINESFSDIWGEFVDQGNSAGHDGSAYKWYIGEDIASHNEWSGSSRPDETGTDCGNGIDNDGDGFIDDGCPGNCHDGIDNDGDGGGDMGDQQCFLRNMQNPPQKTTWWYSVSFTHPDRMSSYYDNAALTVEDDCTTCTGNRNGICEYGEDCIVYDNGGVHINSGIGNKLAFLLTDGGSFNGQTVTAMGISKTADLYYTATAYLLTSGADYADLYHALKMGAHILDWTSTEISNLHNACLAVEINDREIYVDWTNTSGPELGTEADPFNTVTEGYNAASDGYMLIINSGAYDESLTMQKTLKVIPKDGSVVIGR